MALSYEYLKGVESKFLRNMHFSKKHNKKGLKKLQANNSKAMGARVEAIKALQKPKEVKPKISKGSSHKLNRLPYIAHPKFGKCTVPIKPRVSDSAIQSPRPRLQPQLRFRSCPGLGFCQA